MVQSFWELRMREQLLRGCITTPATAALQGWEGSWDTSRTLQAGRRGLPLVKGPFSLVTTTALMRPTSILHLRATRARMEWSKYTTL